MTGFIYNRIEREKNGEKLNITIQQITPDLQEGVIDHMVEHFLPREPLCRHADLLNDSESLESFRKLWHLVLEKGAGIVALLEVEGEQPKIIGANCTGIIRKGAADFPELPGEALRYVIGIVNQITAEANIWERYGVDCYLTALGLSVDRNYHGIGLGRAILEAREKVAEKFNLPLTETVFTAPESQHIARKLGFETLIECPYNEYNFKMSDIYRDLEGSISIMVKTYK